MRAYGEQLLIISEEFLKTPAVIKDSNNGVTMIAQDPNT